VRLPTVARGERTRPRPEEVRFARDSPVEEAVRSELVSEPKFPVIQGKYREFHQRRPSQLESEVEIVIIINGLPANSLRNGAGN
jgi:hypothetical protein